jgi:phage terminase large subunit GpA-like protein
MLKTKPPISILDGIASLWAPPPPLTISQWADRYRYLSPESSSEPGKWRNTRTPYLVEIMDAVSHPTVPEVVFKASSQIGKTELLNCIVGYFISHDPCPILVLQPTLEMAETWSKDRLAPMIRDSPILTGKIADSKSRTSGNCILKKNYPGGTVTIVGANSPSSLASRPIRVVIADEIDRYPESAGTEGDPLNLAAKRTMTFWNRKIIRVSTPTIEGASRIDFDWLRSDQRRYYVPCPHCDALQYLQWKQVKWTELNLAPQDAIYECEHCQAPIQSTQKQKLLLKGEWRATSSNSSIRGYHLNELYSPWRTFGDVVTDFLAAKQDPIKLKTWVNTSLGECWEDQAGEKLDHAELMGRCEPYRLTTVPMGGLLLTCGVDVQKDRLAVAVRAWGRDEESWLVYWIELFGDTAQESTWTQLTEFLQTKWTHESGTELAIARTAIDSSAYTQQVYTFVRTLQKQNIDIIPVKGLSTQGNPVINRPTSQDINHNGRILRSGIKLWPLGVDTAKDTITARFAIKTGPGAYHWPIGLAEQYFLEITAEKKVTKYSKGFAKREWQKIPGRNNESLDIETYAYAAALSLGMGTPRIDWNKLEAQFIPSATPQTEPSTAKVETVQAPQDNLWSLKKSRNNWATKWGPR